LAFVVFGLVSCLRGQEPPATGETPVVAALIEKLRSPEIGTRFQAAKELRKLEAQARAAIPALTRVAEEDADEDIRKTAQETLKTLMGKATTPGPLRTGAPPPPSDRKKPEAKENSLVGVWEGTTNFAGLTMTVTTDFKADGAFQTIMKSSYGGFGSSVIVVRGKYTYSDGVVRVTGAYFGGIVDGLPVNEVYTI
jgi:hypothetical protein